MNTFYEVSDSGDVLPPDMPDEFGWSGTEPDLEYPNTDDPSDVITNTDEPDKLSAAQRVMTVVTEAGFYPRSRREVNLALGAIEHRETPGGFAKYLNEVLQHQDKSTSEDSAAALRAILSDIRGYASEVRGNITALGSAREAIRDVHDQASIGGPKGISDWEHQDLTRRGLRLLTERSYAALSLDEAASPDFDSPVSLDDITTAIAKLRAIDARHQLGVLSDEQRVRRAFWIEQLEAAKKHLAVRGMASRALELLDVAGPER